MWRSYPPPLPRLILLVVIRLLLLSSVARVLLLLPRGWLLLLPPVECAERKPLAQPRLRNESGVQKRSERDPKTTRRFGRVLICACAVEKQVGVGNKPTGPIARPTGPDRTGFQWTGMKRFERNEMGLGLGLGWADGIGHLETKHAVQPESRPYQSPGLGYRALPIALCCVILCRRSLACEITSIKVYNTWCN